MSAPSIAALTHRLSETPAEFLQVDVVDVVAVVSDLLHDLGGALLDASRARAFAKSDARGRQLMLIAAWLLHDDWFLAQQRFAPPAYRLLGEGLDELAAIVDPQQFVSDPDRREELVRIVLRALEVVPEGEQPTQAADRLATLNSIERVRLLRDTRAAQERIRRIQEEMRRKAAEEAAASYGRE
jgi:hypothetical protein